MDLFTHCLAGYAMARAGVERIAPRGLGLVLAASVAPDLDQLARLGGVVTFLEWHQTATHSWLLAPLVAGIVVAAFRLGGPLPWIRSFAVAIAGTLFHDLLDELTAPGVARWWPVSADRFELDLLAPGDFWPAIMLALAMVAPFLSNLVDLEMGGRKGRGRAAAVVALVLLSIYVGVKGQLHATAIEILNSRVYGNAAARRVAACPNSFDPAAWLGVVETAERRQVLTMNLREPFDPEAGELLYPATHPAIQAAENSVLAARLRPYLTWVQWEAIPVGELMEVTGEDLRLGLVLRFEVDAAGRILSEGVLSR